MRSGRLDPALAWTLTWIWFVVLLVACIGYGALRRWRHRSGMRPRVAPRYAARLRQRFTLTPGKGKRRGHGGSDKAKSARAPGRNASS